MPARQIPQYTDLMLQSELARTAARDVTSLDLDGRQAAGEYRAELLEENKRRIRVRSSQRTVRNAMELAQAW